MTRAESVMEQWIASTKPSAFAKIKKAHFASYLFSVCNNDLIFECFLQATRESLLTVIESEKTKHNLEGPEFEKVFRTFKDELAKKSAAKRAKL